MNRRLLGLVGQAAALWGTACGGNGSTIAPPPPTGKYSNSSLSGTYAFTTSGEVFTVGAVAANSLSRVGSFVADGKGGISGGIEDVHVVSVGASTSTITGGSYNIAADGRGTLTLDFAQASINFGIVLTSTSDGLMIDETSNSTQASTGSGNFIKQNTSLCASPVASVNGPYVFDFTGLDSNTSAESFVGEFTANGSNGTTSANLADVNDAFTVSPNVSFVATFSTDSLNPAGPNACGRGIAQIAGTNYAYYVVDATRVRLLSVNNGGALSGDAALQQNIPANLGAINSGFAFVVAGSAANGGFPVGLTRVGRFTVSNSAVSNILLDVNEGGSFRQPNSFSNPSVAYDPTTGRGTVLFQDQTVSYTFVFYLSSATSGVIQEDSLASPNVAIEVADGSILAQSGSPFTSSNITGTYAMNWSGLVTAQGNQDEEDLLAQATVSSLSLSGTADIFQFTSPTLTPLTDRGLNGTININGDGASDDGHRNGINLNLTNTSTIDLVVYFVNPQLAFFANRDNNSRIIVGILKAQQ